MKRLGAAGLALSTPMALHADGPSGIHPNIVLVFTDDLGYGDVGVYGAKGFKTPHLDRLASEGMRFTDFYASQAVCSASRASLLTGCYAERVSIQGALSTGAQVGLNPEETTMAEMLKKQGYATGIFGKWHLGHHKEFLPLQHGFDEYLGLPYSNDMWPVDYDGCPVGDGHKAHYPPLPLIEGNDRVAIIATLEDQATLTSRYTEGALGFIEKHRAQPFFLYLAHSMPHVPLGVSTPFRGSSEQGMFGDVIQEIDDSVGRIMAALEQWELRDNTLVIFTSDNGPWLNFGNHAGSTGLLREGKGTAFEGGPRVPAIMRWPGRIPAGSTCEKMASTLDLLPTL
ncbi:MAG: sulfatase, partial [Planctomycetota bacterium]